MTTPAQNATLERISGADWRVLGECDGCIWIAKQSRIRKVFSRVDEKGALLVAGRLDVVKAFGKAKAIELVDRAFAL